MRFITGSQLNKLTLFGTTLLGSALAFAQTPAGPNRPAGVPEDYVITPFGYFHPSCVRHLATGDNVSADGLVIQHANGTLTNGTPCEYPHYTAGGDVVARDSDTEIPTIGHSWIVDGETSTSTSYGEITTTWNVPSAPTSNDGQVIFFFPGFQGTGGSQSTILQPVLGWNNDFKSAWSLASWNCCPSGTANESTPVRAGTGDSIYGDVKSTCAAGTLTCSKWNVTAQDVNINNNTVATTTLSSTPSEGQTLNWATGGALEVYSVTQCSDYPPNDALTFATALYNNSFSQISNPGWLMVNRAGGLTPQCNYGGQLSGGHVTVIFGTGASLSPTGLSFGTWNIQHGPISRTLTLTNVGTSSIAISGFGGLSDTMSVSGNTCGSTLASGATCSVTVTLTPANAGGAETIIQTLSAFDSAPNSPQKAEITATITCSHSC